MTPEQEALIKRQETPRMERLAKDAQSEFKPPSVETGVSTNFEEIEEDSVSLDKQKSEAAGQREKNTDSESAIQKQKKKSRRKLTSKSPMSDETPEPWITKTYRLPGSLIDRLQMVSLTRRMKKKNPSTQQELLAEALIEWLEKNEEE